MIGMSMAVRPPRQLSLLQQALSTIRRLGGTALYVPDDYTGAYIDSAGTTPVTAVGDVIGLLTDRSYGASNLGPELVVNGDFSDGITGWSAYLSTPVVSSGVLTLTANGAPDYPQLSSSISGLTVGKLYEYRAFAARGTTASPVFISFGGENVTTSSASLVLVSAKWVATTTTTSVSLGIFDVGATGSAIFNNISVREITGNHATQSTTASKPVVALAGGKYAMSFDGSNDRLLTGNVNITDACTIVLGIRRDRAGAIEVLMGEDPYGVQLFLNSDGSIVFSKNGGSTIVSTTSPVGVAPGETCVLSARVNASGAGVICKNGVVLASATVPTTFSATTGIAIGAQGTSGSFAFQGLIFSAVVSNTAVSDADLRTIEQYAASKAGVTLS